MSDTQTDEGFLGRWSRRKSQARQEPEDIPEEVVPEKIETSDVASDTPDQTNEPVTLEAEQTKVVELTDADMPDIDTLDDKSDYTGFMSPKVSEELRKIALRKLFSSSGFNIRDGLDDYDEDFTLSQFEPLGDIVTSDMKHQIEVEAERKLREALEQEEDTEVIDDSEVTNEAENDEVTADETTDSDSDELAAKANETEAQAKTPEDTTSTQGSVITEADISLDPTNLSTNQEPELNKP